MATFAKLNRRRLDLIEKKHRGGGLTNAEAAELDRLKVQVSDHMQQIAPRSTEALEAFERHIAALRRRLAERRGRG